MTRFAIRTSVGVQVSLGSLALIGLCLILPEIAHAVPPSAQERAFNQSLGELRSGLTQKGKEAQAKRLAPYRKFALKQAAKGDVGPLVRSGNAARAARGHAVLPEPSASDKSFTGWEDPNLETAPGDAARAARIEARAAGQSRHVRLRTLDSHDVQLANRRAGAEPRWTDPSLRAAPGDAARAARIDARAASGSRAVGFRELDSHDVQLANRRAAARAVQRVPASSVRTARVARTGRAAATAARTARAAHTAEEAAKVGRTARVARAGVAATGGGLAVIGAQEGLKATTGLDVPVEDYAVRMLFTPVVAAQGGNAGKYAADQNKWFAGTVSSSSKTFVRTFRDPKQFNRNLSNYAHENAPAVKTAGCVLSTPVRGVQALIAHKRLKGC